MLDEGLSRPPGWPAQGWVILSGDGAPLPVSAPSESGPSQAHCWGGLPLPTAHSSQPAAETSLAGPAGRLPLAAARFPPRARRGVLPERDAGLQPARRMADRGVCPACFEYFLLSGPTPVGEECLLGQNAFGQTLFGTHIRHSVCLPKHCMALQDPLPHWVGQTQPALDSPHFFLLPELFTPDIFVRLRMLSSIPPPFWHRCPARGSGPASGAARCGCGAAAAPASSSGLASRRPITAPSTSPSTSPKVHWRVRTGGGGGCGLHNPA